MRVGFLAIPIVLLSLHFMLGCGGSASDVDPRQAEIIAPLASANDVASMRNAIYTLSRDRSDKVPSVLNALWDGSVTVDVETNALLRHRGVRLMIAQVLLERGKGRSDHVEYIKRSFNDSNGNLAIYVAEALREIGDEESHMMLAELAASDDKALSEIALSGIAHDVHFGRNQASAASAWQKVTSDTRVDRGLVRKYEEIYASSGSLGRGDANVSAGKHYSGFLISEEIVALMQGGEYARAAEIVRIDAERGSVEAQNLLGTLYLAMTPPLYAEALKWFEEASSRDFAAAKVNLATMYLSGHGVERDSDGAIELLDEASRAGDERAKRMLDSMIAK